MTVDFKIWSKCYLIANRKTDVCVTFETNRFQNFPLMITVENRYEKVVFNLNCLHARVVESAPPTRMWYFNWVSERTRLKSYADRPRNVSTSIIGPYAGIKRGSLLICAVTTYTRRLLEIKKNMGYAWLRQYVRVIFMVSSRINSPAQIRRTSELKKDESNIVRI